MICTFEKVIIVAFTDLCVFSNDELDSLTGERSCRRTCRRIVPLTCSDEQTVGEDEETVHLELFQANEMVVWLDPERA